MSVLIVTLFTFVFLFALVGVIYPTPLHKAVRLISRRRNTIACLAAAIICMIAASIANTDTVPAYTVVSDKFVGGKFDPLADNNQKHIRVVTAATTKEELNAIVRDVMDRERSHHLASVHLFIHGGYDKDKDLYREFKAHARIAYTKMGLLQTGVEKTNTYDIAYEPGGKFEKMK
jgi:hypothetical protein